MNALEQCRAMAVYNRWMNERLYGYCAQLTDAQRREDVGAFFKSIHGTLSHLLLRDRLWMGRFLSQPFVAKSLDQELYSDFVALRGERAKTDAQIEAWAQKLTDAILDSGVTDLMWVPLE